MDSHQILKESMSKVGIKSIAADMNLSTSLLYKWCQPKDHEDASGADNPLDRLSKIIELTGDTRPIQWLCEGADGYFAHNPPLKGADRIPLIDATRSILKEFSELLDVISESIQNDGRISNDEAERIRSAWEDLKSLAEQFVTSCEQGVYRE
jgi:hypothetical protein